MKDLLNSARINGAAAQSYAAKLKQHKIDQTLLGSLTLQQLHDIGITALGDRLKIFNFFSKDTDHGASLPFYILRVQVPLSQPRCLKNNPKRRLQVRLPARLLW